MPTVRFALYLVHLYQHGSYVRTLPRAFSLAGATACVAQYNQLGQREGRTAELAPLPLECTPRLQHRTAS